MFTSLHRIKLNLLKHGVYSSVVRVKMVSSSIWVFSSSPLILSGNRWGITDAGRCLDFQFKNKITIIGRITDLQSADKYSKLLYLKFPFLKFSWCAVKFFLRCCGLELVIDLQIITIQFMPDFAFVDFCNLTGFHFNTTVVSVILGFYQLWEYIAVTWSIFVSEIFVHLIFKCSIKTLNSRCFRPWLHGEENDV